jgi:hypothetical protein
MRTVVMELLNGRTQKHGYCNEHRPMSFFLLSMFMLIRDVITPIVPKKEHYISNGNYSLCCEYRGENYVMRSFITCTLLQV